MFIHNKNKSFNYNSLQKVCIHKKNDYLCSVRKINKLIQLKITVMKKLFTLENLITVLIIVAFSLMFTAVFAKSLTLLVAGIFIILIPLPIIVILSENEDR